MADTQQVVGVALTHFRAGRLDRAADVLRRALQRDPSHPGANQLYALTLHALNKSESAVYFIERSIQARPRHAEFYSNLGLIKSSIADLAGAEAAFRKVLELDPAHAAAAPWLGRILAERGAHLEAIEVLRRALEIDGLNIQATSILATVRSEMARGEEAIALVRDAQARLTAAGREVDGPAIGVLCTLTNYVSDDPAQVMDLHQQFGRYIDSVVPLGEREPARPRSLPNGERVRVGYLSPDMCRHSVASFFEPLLESLDRSRFEVFVYSLGSRVDDVTHRLKSLAEHWRQIGPIPDGPVLEAVRRDKLDVVVELSGHTINNRLKMLARRAAPVQVTFLGYPATTGCPGIDVRIVDWTTDPEGAEAFATERLIRLDRCFLCYKPPRESPAVAARADGAVVFGSFNNPAKISESTVELWARTLHAVPGSRLILKGLSLGVAEVGNDLKGRFQARGIDSSRIETLGKFADPAAHLAAYSEIDISLDPTPYNGTTTTCEALWMGVPVVTLRGRTHAARVGASLLSSAGLTELVADSPEDYVRIATALATDGDRRRELRRTLRDRIAGSALCDSREYAAAFERVLSDVVRAEPSRP